MLIKLINKKFFVFNKNKIKKIGVIGLRHEINIGNNLIKYAISIKLSEFGFIPYIIGTHFKNYNIKFIKEKTNLRIIKRNFKEIKKNEYDILMVNSDQTWRILDEHFYDYGFLRFAQKWNIPKFVYGASIGYEKWKFNKRQDKIIRHLIKNFTGISVREKGSIKLIKTHLGIEPEYVLDPTLLIDKKYYLYLIKDFKSNININDKYILTYLIKEENQTLDYIKKASQELKYKNYFVRYNINNVIENFLYGMVHCNAVITNSFHGTIFAIIFNKPFISFIFQNSPKERLISLKETLNLQNRIYDYDKIPKFSLLKKPLNINKALLHKMKLKSIEFLKKNLGII